MALRRCPRPESYSDSKRLRKRGRRSWHEKGCGTNICGFCGPRLADDWARAVGASHPSAYIRLALPEDAIWNRVRKNMNELTSKLRKQDPDSAAVWWVEPRAIEGQPGIRYIERGGSWAMDDFRRLAASRTFRNVYFDFEPEEEGDAELWQAGLRWSILRPVREALEAPTYELATAWMRQHMKLNGGSGEPTEADGFKSSRMVHVAGQFFRSPEGLPLEPGVSLRRASVWRNRPRGEVEAEAKQQVESFGLEEPDLVWHDELWWRTWRGHASRRNLDEENMGLNPFDPPEDMDPAVLRELEERRWAAMHPTSDVPEEGPLSDLDALAAKMFLDREMRFVELSFDSDEEDAEGLP